MTHGNLSVNGSNEVVVNGSVAQGSGGNLLEMLRLGFAPEHLSGVELLPERRRRRAAACRRP